MADAAANRLSERSKWWLSVAVTLLMVLLLLALAEGAMRVRQWMKYGAAARLDEMYIVDQKLDLRVLIPGKRTSTIAINSSGFRGPEITQPKPANTVRLAFVGASTTYCAEVSGNDMVWPHLVAGDLRQHFAQRQIDYVNGGVPGYTIDASLKNLRHRLAPLKPDVIVMYEGFNDLSGETRELATKQGIATTEFKRESWLARYSLLWFLVEKNLRMREAQQAAAKQQRRLELDAAALGAGFKQQLTELVQEAKQHARVVALVTLSQQLRAQQSAEEQLRAAGSALYYMPFMTPATLIESYARYNQIIAQVAVEQGVILIAGEDAIPGDAEHFNDTVHFKDAGSRLMAKRVSDALAASDALRNLMQQ